MNYCSYCNHVINSNKCNICGNKNMREVNGEDYCYFATLNNLQAQMLIPMLEEEKIEVVSMPMYFFGVTYSSAGKSSSKKLYIRYKNFEKAKKIYNDYFKN